MKRVKNWHLRIARLQSHTKFVELTSIFSLSSDDAVEWPLSGVARWTSRSQQ